MVRRVAFVTGEILVDHDYRPRPEYGLVTPLLGPVEGGVTARAGAEWLVLSSPIDLDLTAGRHAMSAGDVHFFTLHRFVQQELHATV